MADDQSPAATSSPGVDRHAGEDRPLDPEKLLRLAGLVKGVLEELRQMDPNEQTADDLAALYQRVSVQIADGLPNSLRQELDAMDLGLPFEDGATPQEVRLAYAGLIGWVGGLFQGLQAALQYQQMQANLAPQQGGLPADVSPGGQMNGAPEHATGQYL